MERLDRVGVDAALQPIVARWLELLREWNKRMDLTAARDEDELHDLMLADAAILASHIEEGLRVVDVGSGAGAPGLALALLRPDLNVTLVEPLAKRVAFLRTVVGTLATKNVTIHREKGDATAARAERFDVAISRATLAPPAWIPLGLRLAPTAWALLAREEPPAIEGAHIAEDVAYTWPLTSATRRAVRYTVR